jgi:hypothetical protein
MSNYAKLAGEATDQYLAALAETQEQYLKNLKAWTGWVPSAPATPTFTSDFLPTPQEVAEANFAFMAKLLKQQKSFAERVFSTATPAG